MSSIYEGCYLTLDDDFTYWFIKDGERRAVSSLEQFGLRPVHTVTPGQLEAFPIAGSKKTVKKVGADA